MERKTKQPGGVKETPAGATRAKARAKKASGAATTEAKKAQGGRRGKKQNGEADLEIVKDLLESFKEKMKNNFKPGVGDLIRLMQLRRELEKDDVREILVQWVDQTKELDSSSEE